MRELGSGTTYNTHNTTSLIRTLKYVSDILQTEEAFTVEEYKHTHTHTNQATMLDELQNQCCMNSWFQRQKFRDENGTLNNVSVSGRYMQMM